MTQSYAPENKSQSIMGLALWALFIGYFTFHLIQGDRGLLSMLRLQAMHKQAEIKREALAQERAALEKTAQLLHPRHIDPDMLDEQARRQLGYIAKGETMVILPKALNDAVSGP